MTEARKQELAAELRLPVAALDAVPLIGFREDDQRGPCFTFPEVDAGGTVIGVNRRYADGRKMAMPGGRRGLTVPSGLRDRTGPVFVVEGPTDTMAMTVAGLACVGRPSNSSGSPLLAALLGDLPPDRPIIVVGENDRKADGKWPGLEGAEHVAGKLARALGRPVSCALPPPDAKDVRDWLSADARGDAGWPARGTELQEELTGTAKTVAPPRDLNGRAESSSVDAAATPQASGTLRQPPAIADTADQVRIPGNDELVELAATYKYDPRAFMVEKMRLKKRGLPISDVMRTIKPLAARMPDREPARPARQLYSVAHGRIWRNATNGDGQVALCNFIPRIVAEVTKDDGDGHQRFIRVAGRLETGEELDDIDVTTTEFAEMNWPLTKWGTKPVVFPGQEKHLRTALQLLRGDVRQETVYTHTGWREVGGRWAYMHAGGAIGAAGPVAGVRVELHPQLARYTLPDPPTGERLRAAVRAALGLLRDLAPDGIAFPVLIAPYRAALGGADYTFALIGKTGSGKSQLAALAQQHFGPKMDGLALPASWLSTANANEGLAFAAKDALLVVDDFKPNNLAQRESEKLHAAAEKLVRAQGNHAGRSRMTADGRVRAGRGPRGMLFITGEDTPGGASLRARMWVVDVAKGDIDLDPSREVRLTECQRDAEAGLYAESLAGFIKWLAIDLPAQQDQFQADMKQRRTELFGIGGHNRVPTTTADLLVMLDLFLEFAVETRAVTPGDAGGYRDRGRAALVATAAAQAEHQCDADPAARFVALIGSAVSSGHAHFADRKTGKKPDADEAAAAAGWRNEGGDWKAQGSKIGWIGGGHVLLDPDATMAVVGRLAAAGGNPLPVSQRTLWKQLYEAGYLAETEGGRDDQPLRYVVRRDVAPYRKRPVVVLPADRLCT